MPRHSKKGAQLPTARKAGPAYISKVLQLMFLGLGYVIWILVIIVLTLGTGRDGRIGRAQISRVGDKQFASRSSEITEFFFFKLIFVGS